VTAIDQLVRLHRWNLDEKRQKLADLERLRERLMGNIESMEANLHDEKAAAAGSDVTSITLPAFIRTTLERRKKIEESIEEVDRSIAAARDEITEAYQEFKKYETAHGNHQRREEQKRSKREQLTADEMSLEVHRRQAAGGG